MDGTAIIDPWDEMFDRWAQLEYTRRRKRAMVIEWGDAL